MREKRYKRNTINKATKEYTNAKKTLFIKLRYKKKTQKYVNYINIKIIQENNWKWEKACQTIESYLRTRRSAVNNEKLKTKP